MTASYAIVIFPVYSDTAGVERFRRTWDPLAGGIPAHITLVYPFQTDVAVQVLEATVSKVAQAHRPFQVELGDPP